jgi:phage tail-like protein
MGGPMQAFGHYSFKLANIKEADQGLKFFRATMPNGTIEIANTKAWGSKWAPEPIAGGGHQVSWQPITLTRYKDDSTALYDWFAAVVEKGVVPGETTQDPTMTCLNNDEPLFTWALTAAVATAYSQSDADAQSHGLLTETVTLTYETATLKKGAG